MGSVGLGMLGRSPHVGEAEVIVSPGSYPGSYLRTGSSSGSLDRVAGLLHSPIRERLAPAPRAEHSLAYVTPSHPQTGAYIMVHATCLAVHSPKYSPERVLHVPVLNWQNSPSLQSVCLSSVIAAVAADRDPMAHFVAGSGMNSPNVKSSSGSLGRVTR